jgi:ABC transport system ATP-binding/permease protein
MLDAVTGGAGASVVPIDRVISSGPVLIGRDVQDAQIPLPHPSVSRRHARLSLDAGGRTVVEDLGSTNGTFVDGALIRGQAELRVGGLLQIGPFRLVRTTRGLEPAASPEQNGITAHDVSGGAGSPRRLLDRVSFSAHRGALTCILGPSGCGKSTLLSVLAGRSAPTRGYVTALDADVHREYDRIKQQLGFVPQREALRDELTVSEFLRYSAQLRLPADLTRAESDDLILRLVEQTGLAERLDSRIHTLSGGERRRLGMVNELLGRPAVLLLDEVTSGLDEEAAHELMRLIVEVAQSGVAVVCVTHTIAAVEPYAHHCLVLAPGGVPVFLGPPRAAARHLGVESIAGIYGALRQPGVSRLPALAGPPASASSTSSGARRPFRRAVRETVTLSSRYVAVLAGDPRALALAIGQSVVIGALLRLLYGTSSLSMSQRVTMGFLVAVSAFWFGCNNAAKEIVKEQALLRQEWSAGVSSAAYAFSKGLVLIALGAMQVLLLVGVIGGLGTPLSETTALIRTALAGVVSGTAIGLLVSAASRTTDAATTALPILLIPQLLLSEVLVSPLPGLARGLAEVAIPAYWLQQETRRVFGDSSIAVGTPASALAAQISVCVIAFAIVLSRRLRSGDR